MQKPKTNNIWGRRPYERLTTRGELTPPSIVRWRSARASGLHPTGRRPRTVSATPSRRSARATGGRLGSRRLSQPFARRSRRGVATASRSSGRRPRTVSATLSRLSARGTRNGAAPGGAQGRRRSRPFARRRRSGHRNSLQSSGLRRRAISVTRASRSGRESPERRSLTRRSLPTTRHFANTRASALPSTGPRLRTISALRSRQLVSGRGEQRGLRRRSPPIAPRWRSERASVFH
jgi:hypothetical protein